MANTQILIVDDDQELREVINDKVAQHFSHKVLHADSVFLASKQLQKHRVDIVISDFEMPGENGLALYRLCQSLGESPLFIFFTGSRKSVIDQAKHNDGTWVIEKPCLEDLVTILKCHGKWYSRGRAA